MARKQAKKAKKQAKKQAKKEMKRKREARRHEEAYRAPSDGAPELVCASAELDEGANRVVVLRGEEVAVWRVRGQLYAIANRCAHKRARLSLGDIEDLGECGAGAHPDGSVVGGLAVRCPKHRRKFGGALNIVFQYQS